MNTDRYYKLLSNNDVIKGGGIVDEYFLPLNKNFIIHFNFFYLHPFSNSYHTITKSRIKLSLFPKVNLIHEILPKIISDKVIILANAESQFYALTYELSIDNQKKEIFIQLLEEPYLGEKRITQVEKSGIILNF